MKGRESGSSHPLACFPDVCSWVFHVDDRNPTTWDITAGSQSPQLLEARARGSGVVSNSGTPIRSMGILNGRPKFAPQIFLSISLCVVLVTCWWARWIWSSSTWNLYSGWMDMHHRYANRYARNLSSTVIMTVKSQDIQRKKYTWLPPSNSILWLIFTPIFILN